MRDIVVATRNAYKVRELSALLRIRGVRWLSLNTFPHIGAIPERGRTFEANAVAKARAVARKTGKLALADDSGLEVTALRGAPGVRSARFAGWHGDNQANNEKLLRVLADRPMSERGARYVCVLAVASPTRLLAVTRGTWRGRIATTPAGRGGFGYDPMFYLPSRRRTVAQIPASAKNRLSHRARAARRLRPFLQRFIKTTTPSFRIAD